MAAEWKIREFEESDLPAVMELNRTCLPENYPDNFFMGIHYHAPKSFLVADTGGSVIGYIMCRIERGISSFGHRPVKKGHIVSVAVRKDMRRRGVGSALITAAMRAMNDYGASEYFLEVRRSNEDAISVYERLGFRMVRVLKAYYRDGEDAFLMVRQRIE